MLWLSVYEGTWTHSSPLISMNLLDSSCVIVGKSLKLHATFPYIWLLSVVVCLDMPVDINYYKHDHLMHQIYLIMSLAISYDNIPCINKFDVL